MGFWRCLGLCSGRTAGGSCRATADSPQRGNERDVRVGGSVRFFVGLAHRSFSGCRSLVGLRGRTLGLFGLQVAVFGKGT
jgi:hypothetical protein